MRPAWVRPDHDESAKKTIKIVDRYQQRYPWLAFPIAVWKKFNDDQAGNLAALVAYFAFASLFPLLLVLFTVMDIVLRDHPALKAEPGKRRGEELREPRRGPLRVNSARSTRPARRWSSVSC